MLSLPSVHAVNNPSEPGSSPPSQPRGLQRPVQALQWRPMEVLINGTAVGSWVLLERQGALMASASMLESWRVRTPARELGFEYWQDRWYPLSALAGFSAHFDPVEQALKLQFSAEAFRLTRLAPEEAGPPPVSPSLWAGFVNYDLSTSQQHNDNTATIRNWAGLWELGVTSPHGVLTSSHVLRQSSLTAGELREQVRLETTYSRDFPLSQLTLRVGDSNTSGVAGSRAVFFGGVQLARNFGLRPGFTTQPVPVLTGAASSASTVEMYVDGALRQVSRVPSGPFTLQDPGLLGVDGQVRLVVRDVLGRETVLSQTLYRHASLLAPGLSDWALEAGALRYQLGQSTSHYGENFVSGHWRQGWSPRLTLQSHAQGSRELQNLRAGAIIGLPAGWLLDATAAHSRHRTVGSGLEGSLGLQYQHAGMHLYMQTQHTQVNYRALGISGANAYTRQDTLSAGMPISSVSHLALNRARVQGPTLGEIDTRSLVYSHRVGQARLSLNLTQVQGSRHGKSAMLLWIMPLGEWVPGASTQAFAGQQDHQTTWNAGVTRPPGPDATWGWRLLSSQTAGTQAQELGLYHLGERMQLQSDFKHSSSGQFARLSLQGAWVAVDGDLYATRHNRGSFAAVEVPGLPGVGVGLQGRVQAHTNARGRALLTGLQDHHSNNITLNPNDLPIGAEIDNIAHEVVPPRRGAVKAHFAVRAGQSALLTIVLDDGSLAPAGARVRIEGDSDPARVFHVARKGQVFVTGLSAHNTLQLRFGQQSCTLALSVPQPDPHTIWRPAPLTCQEQRP